MSYTFGIATLASGLRELSVGNDPIGQQQNNDDDRDQRQGYY